MSLKKQIPKQSTRVPVTSPDAETITRLLADVHNYVSQISALIQDKTNLDKTIKNQKEEIDEWRGKRLLTEEQWQAFLNQTAQLNAHAESDNQMALWLRKNKGQEIEQGRHTGLTLAQIMIMYASASCPLPGAKEKGN